MGYAEFSMVYSEYSTGARWPDSPRVGAALGVLGVLPDGHGRVLGVLTAGYIGGLTCPAHVPPLGHALHASPADRRGTPSTHNGVLNGYYEYSQCDALGAQWVLRVLPAWCSVHARAAWLSLG
jgi:hypothetical protein